MSDAVQAEDRLRQFVREALRDRGGEEGLVAKWVERLEPRREDITAAYVEASGLDGEREGVIEALWRDERALWKQASDDAPSEPDAEASDAAMVGALPPLPDPLRTLLEEVQTERMRLRLENALLRQALGVSMSEPIEKIMARGRKR